MTARLERARARLTQADRLLATLKLSDQAILDRGYALVLDAQGGVLRRASEVSPGAPLSLRFADGDVQALATSGEATTQAAPKGAGEETFVRWARIVVLTIRAGQYCSCDRHLPALIHAKPLAARVDQIAIAVG